MLAIDDEDGDIIEQVAGAIEAIVAGSLLAELVLQKRLQLVDSKVSIIDQTLTEQPVLDKVLYAILDTARERKLKYWFNTLVYKKFLEEVIHQLVVEGVLIRKKKRHKLTFMDGGVPKGQVTAQFLLKNRLREIVLAGQSPELAEVVLLALIYHANLLKLVFTQGERKTAQKRIKKLVEKSKEDNDLDGQLEEIILTVSG